MPAISASTQLDETPTRPLTPVHTSSPQAETRKDDESPAPQNPHQPRETDQTSEQSAADSSGANTLADINDILERMAGGTLYSQDADEPPVSPAEDRRAAQFEPIPDPPVEEEDRIAAQKKPREDTLAPPSPSTDSAVRRAWDYVTADNTGIPPRREPAEAERKPEGERGQKESAYDPLSALDRDPNRR
jgi:hypothetical protein